jgi:hypothetical protein
LGKASRETGRLILTGHAIFKRDVKVEEFVVANTETNVADRRRAAMSCPRGP